ncbi:MAG: DegT/DnrJ/EryC1/StrS family aminotransferase [Candidatus Rokubacteria bacterium]|nr:DegT/DnrJ/EryC1/StrS family aminotransferase [Candidatus Rokubacteria bacterium]
MTTPPRVPRKLRKFALQSSGRAGGASTCRRRAPRRRALHGRPRARDPSPTFAGSAFPITYPGAAPVIAVHLSGQPADMDALTDICARHEVPLIEAAAESLGATLRAALQTRTSG